MGSGVPYLKLRIAVLQKLAAIKGEDDASEEILTKQVQDILGDDLWAAGALQGNALLCQIVQIALVFAGRG